MKRTRVLFISAKIITLVSISLIAFGMWGLFTKSGNTMFDEMAGMIPCFAGLAGVILLAVSLGLQLCSHATREKTRLTKRDDEI